jgi:peroxiredoxin
MRNDDRDAQPAPQLGARVPPLTLPSTIGPLDLQHVCAGRAVLYIYPATGVPDRNPALDPAPGWDDMPGASGCTSQCIGFKQAYDRFANQGIRVAGISSQPLAEQRDFVARHAIPFPLLCDEVLALQRAWALPIFSVGGRTFLERLMLYIAANRIERVIYPVVAPAESAERMLELLNEPVA